MSEIRKLISVITTNGVIASLLNLMLVSFVSSAIEVDVWEYNLLYLVLYSVLVSAVLYANTRLALFSRAQFGVLFILIILSFLGLVHSPLTLSAIVLVVAAVFLSSALTQWLTPNINRYLIASTIVTAIIGSIWTISTSPYYAEGFVVLTWLILAVVNLVILVGFYFANQYFNKQPEVKKYKNTVVKSVALLTLGATLSVSSLYYMIWKEGEPTTPLVRDSSWNNAISKIDKVPAELTNNMVATEITKQKFVEYLLRDNDKELSPSQMATLYFLTGDKTWSNKFKTVLLEEAEANKFTGKTDSMKFAQREAMTRAMFLLELQKKIANYLTTSEQALLTSWFENIAQRIFQPEWVDYLYAVPFKDDPDGPYLNQEVGASTLAVLQHVIEEETLKQQITQFLSNKSAGFLKNFRNPDDSIGYQNVWIENAFVMHLYTGKDAESLAGMQLAIKWLMTQLPQSIVPIGYGLPTDLRPITTLGIGAFYLKNPKARWLLEKHMNKIMEDEKGFPPELFAFWLWDETVPLEKPYFESVVIDGPTGYAFRPGPISADKVVLRSIDNKTKDEATFLLANLRNIGWHRYPATNTTINLLFDGYSMVGEDIIKKSHNWLPQGRAKHRDKKIDRVRLNGLQIARDGIDAWVGGITGVYSSWRQDVPRLSQVKSVRNVDGLKSASITLADWADTNHTRTYVVAGDRQVFVIDEMSTLKPSLPKQITWHIQPDMIQTSALLFENQKYAISLSDNVKNTLSVIQKEVAEKSAYSSFSSDKFISLGITDFIDRTVVTAFSSKDNLVSEINTIADSSSIYQKVFSYKLNGKQKYLVLSKKHKWMLIDSFEE